MKIAFVFGTRPEAIKLAPVINEFKSRGNFEINICFTGQHQEMVKPILELFKIQVDTSLSMPANQTLSEMVGNLFIKLGHYIEHVKPDIMVVQGDTNTAMAAATSAFYSGVKVAHIEAGLRTHNMYAPFPEELNRITISKVAHFHFTPTEGASQNLVNEGVDSSQILMTGNTGIDALLFALNKSNQLSKIAENEPWLKNKNKIVLITGHRRENFGTGFENICKAIKKLALMYPDINFVYPVHLNPNVKQPVSRILRNVSNIYLIEPLPYFDFISLMNMCYFILTDSGGIQEEAPSLGKPILVMRNTTERQEAIDGGNAKLVGTDPTYIVKCCSELLDNEVYYNSMSNRSNPFGDGNASSKIYNYLINILN